MRKKQKTENQKERDKKGADRIKKFEDKQVVETPVEENEEDFMIVYQKKEPGEWEQIKIPYKRKKKL